MRESKVENIKEANSEMNKNLSRAIKRLMSMKADRFSKNEK